MMNTAQLNSMQKKEQILKILKLFSVFGLCMLSISSRSCHQQRGNATNNFCLMITLSSVACFCGRKLLQITNYNMKIPHVQCHACCSPRQATTTGLSIVANISPHWSPFLATYDGSVRPRNSATSFS